MNINNFQPPKSSFLSINKDMRLLTDKFLTNDRLCKLLYYTDKDPLSKPIVTDEDKIAMFGKNIKIVPKLYVDGSVLNYIVIKFNNFMESSNPQFRDNVIMFDIICHYDQWNLKDFDLRPYRIAAEIDSMLDKQKLTGIGELHFLYANQLILTDEFGGFCLAYQTYHGGEDKLGMPDPAEQEKFEQEFKEMTETQKEQKEMEYPDGLQASIIYRD